MEWLRRKISSSRDSGQPVVIQVATVSAEGLENASAEEDHDAHGILKNHFHFLYLVGQCPCKPGDGTQAGTKHKIHLVSI